jgi:hypothetical protein
MAAIRVSIRRPHGAKTARPMISVSCASSSVAPPLRSLPASERVGNPPGGTRRLSCPKSSIIQPMRGDQLAIDIQSLLALSFSSAGKTKICARTVFCQGPFFVSIRHYADWTAERIEDMRSGRRPRAASVLEASVVTASRARRLSRREHSFRRYCQGLRWRTS